MITLKQMGLLICALAITVIASLGTIPLRNSPTPMMRYGYSVVHQRGPTAYMALFMTIYVISASVAATGASEKGVKRLTAISLLVLSFGPLCIGYIGYIQGIGTMNLGIERLSTDPHTIQELRRIAGQIAVGKTVACDPLILGLIGTFVSLTASLTVWRQSRIECRTTNQSADVRLN